MAERKRSPGDAARKAETRAAHVPAVRAARDLAWAGQQARAIETCTRALDPSATPPRDRFELLDLRSEAYVAVGRLEEALRDADELQQLAATLDRSAAVRASCALAQVLTRQGDNAPATSVARQALDAARQLGDDGLAGLALFRLSVALWRRRDGAGGLRAAQEATAQFEAVGDDLWTGRALWSQACALADLGRAAEGEKAAARAATPN